jgi:predicted permease
MMRLYRLLLHLYPAAFRDEYAEAMCQAFAHRLRHLHGPFAPLTAAILAIADVVPNAAAEQVRAIRYDLHLARRAFARAPYFYLAIVGVLALGTGANGAVFGVLRAILLQPLPYAEPDRLVMVWQGRPVPNDPALTAQASAGPQRGVLTIDQLMAVRGQSGDVLTDVAAMRTWQTDKDAQMDLQVPEAARLRTALVTPNFFEVLGARAAVGRAFGTADGDDGIPRVVISDRLWHRVFGGDPRIIGRAITLVGGRPRASRSFTVVAVLPQRFRFTYPDETEAWILAPWSEVARYPRGVVAFTTVGRLQRDVSIDVANGRLASIRDGFTFPGMPESRRPVAHAESVRDWVIGETRQPLFLLASAAGLMLVITCLTIMSALFVRLGARHREIAVRGALGASPARLRRELLTHGAALSVAGVTVGFVAAAMLLPILRALVPSSFPRGDEIGAGLSMFPAAAALAIFVTMLATLAPAWSGGQLASAATLDRLKSAAAGRSANTVRYSLIASQSAIATSFLFVSALLVASFWRLGHVPLGFDADAVIAVETRAFGARYNGDDALRTLQSRVLDEVRAIPGVRDVGMTSALPFRGVDFTTSIGDRASGQSITVKRRMVDAGYFRVMRVPLLRGRMFDSTDVASSQPVVIISDSLARRLFPKGDPLGQVIDAGERAIVVGVVADVRYAGFDHDPDPALYLSRAQVPENLLCLVIRASPAAANLQVAIRNAFRRAAADVPVVRMQSIRGIMDETIAPRRFYTVATVSFAALALALTIAGLVIAVSRSVVERRRELAIRSALGATSRRLMQLTLRPSLIATSAGAVIGIVIAISGSRLIESFLFRIPARDPLTSVGTGLLLVGASTLASMLAARRVMAVTPAEALRDE